MRAVAGRTRLRALARLMAVVACAALLATPAVTSGLAAIVSGHDEVIAQGVAPMPSGPVSWRITSHKLAAQVSARVTTPLGFTVADEDSFVVTDQRTGNQVILDPGEAAFHAAGAKETRMALDDQSGTYWEVALVSASDARDASASGGGTLLFGGTPFTVPAGDREARLSRDVLAAGETGRFVGSRTPMVFFVTSGALSVTDRGGKAREIAAGQAAQVSGDLTVRGGQDGGGAYVVARVGRSVPRVTATEATTTPTPTPVPPCGSDSAPACAPSPPATRTPQPTEAPQATGTFRITLFSCPQGVDPSQSPDGCQPGQSADGGYIRINQGEIVASGEQFMIADGARDGDAYVLAGVPAASYAIKGFTKPGADAVLYIAPPAEAGQDAWMVTIGAGQTVSVNAYWFDPSTLGSATNTSDGAGESGAQGQLALWFYTCPAGTDPTSNESLSACQASDDPYGFAIVDTQGSGETYSTADASRNNGGYIFAIPASVYQLSAENVPANIDIYVAGTDVAGGGRDIAIHVVAGQASNVSIYLVPAGGGNG